MECAGKAALFLHVTMDADVLLHHGQRRKGGNLSPQSKAGARLFERLPVEVRHSAHSCLNAPNARVKFSRFREQLTLGQMVLIHDQRTDDPLG